MNACVIFTAVCLLIVMKIGLSTETYSGPILQILVVIHLLLLGQQLFSWKHLLNLLRSLAGIPINWILHQSQMRNAWLSLGGPRQSAVVPQQALERGVLWGQPFQYLDPSRFEDVYLD
ncbi:hypothetical protein F5Y17DRAFT_28680 [Xylariaceae sp. FL0594]|nr:hypothetical protein F5Y17DRAFT_28680 [Xylariaceae sp. FL0594]